MRKFIFICGFGILSFFQGCTSEDVKPTVTLEASSTNLDFNNGTVKVFAVLNGVINKEIKVKLSFEGTAAQGTDYITSGTEITISAGTDRGSIVLTGIPSTDTIRKQILIGLEATDEAVVLPPANIEITMLNCGGDRDGDGINDCDDQCPDEAGPAANNGCPWPGLIVNEVLYDPPSGDAGDANKDGIRDPLADEFVELYNDGEQLDISGYTLSDAAMVRHTFPSGTIVPSKGVVVVFGGGSPTDSFGGAIVQTASEGQLNLNNAGDVLTLRNEKDSVLQVFDINGLSGNPDESYSRNPDIKGPFERHSLIPAAAGALFSPGTRNNGSDF